MQIKLSQPLQKGKTYSASLFAHLFLDTGLDNVGIFRSSDISTNNIGMYFSVDSLIRVELEADRHGQLLTVTPQVNSARILDDAQHWAQVSGCFVAQQDYQYLTIGNFFDDAHTYKQKVYAGYSSNLISYYLIDDISVELVQEKPLTTFSIGPDTVLCPGQVLSLNIPDTARLNYQWQDGKLGRTYTITKSGTYWVTAIQGKCMISDTIHVQVLSPVKLPADTVLCEGESLSLVVDHPLKSYLWNTQSTDSTLVVNLSGIYWIQVISNHCWLSDSIQVQFVACPGEVPNVITPNEDGKNDRFVVAHADLVPWQLGIYNRWGRQVYFNTHYQNEWDGGGLPAGTYYYHLWSPVLKRALKGWLMILR